MCDSRSVILRFLHQPSHDSEIQLRVQKSQDLEMTMKDEISSKMRVERRMIDDPLDMRILPSHLHWSFPSECFYLQMPRKEG